VKRRRTLTVARIALGAVLAAATPLAAWIFRVSNGRGAESDSLVAELAARTAAIPPDERAWPVYRATLIALRAGREDELHYEPSDRDRWEEYSVWLRTQRASVDALISASHRSALGLPWGSTDIGMPDRSVDENERLHDAMAQAGRVGGPLRNVARILRSGAHIALEDGDIDRAVTAFDAACRACAHGSEGEATLTMQMSASASVAATIQMLERLLADPRARVEPHLLAIAESLDRAEAAATIRFAPQVPFELAQLDSMYAPEGWGGGRLTRDAVDDARIVAEWDRQLGISDETSTDELAAPTIWIQLRAPFRQDAKRDIETIAVIADEVLRSTAADRRVALDRLPARAPYESAVAPLASMRSVLHAILKMSDSVVMELDAHRLAVAILIHRARTSAWPDQLRPPPSLRIPTDRLMGEPLRWLATEDRLIIYSIGLDGLDDGGTPIPPPPGEDEAVQGWGQVFGPIDGPVPKGDVVITSIELRSPG